MSLHMFYKKKEDIEQQQKYTKVDLNSLLVDTFERPSIELYHVNQRDEIRRAYLQKWPFHPLNHKFPPHDFGAWNRKSGIDKHKEGTIHIIAVQKCQSLMNQRQSITSAFEKQTSLKEKEYQTRLNASIDCVRFLLRKGLAFRGHNDKEDSNNKDHVVLKNAPKNSQMKCGEIQKDIVQACSDLILNVITGDLGNGFFAIFADESHDVSCKEQLALVLRFVNRKCEIVERFVGLRNVNDTSALSLKATIYDMLSKWNLSPTRIRGQCYDGASNMSGAFNGLKTLIMNETKSAHFLLNIIGTSYKQRDELRKKQAAKVMAALAEGDLESGTGLNQELDIKRPSDT
ncbi:uncharacterized protein LOC111898664 [Lactuca sativa]|uniref:uncharacterized protein LOC111898664 n=1 Tax=Lactuca sativa TaxID=4236 RepID=UPI000CD7FB72|nr:uncharacterized protein LOC111898664 [Lactuca sativa]